MNLLMQFFIQGAAWGVVGVRKGEEELIEKRKNDYKEPTIFSS
jgi:hypothetical protein